MVSVGVCVSSAVFVDALRYRLLVDWFENVHEDGKGFAGLGFCRGKTRNATASPPSYGRIVPGTT
jgi:hypothetical protein